MISVGPFIFYMSQDSWLSPRAVRYALEHLWTIVSGGASHYEGKPIISFSAVSVQAADQLIAAEEKSVGRISIHDLLPKQASSISLGSLPGLFGPVLGQCSVEYSSEGILNFHIDLPSLVFFMLSRWEETVVPTRDEHGRFPATASVAYKQGFLDRPIVDEYALILREWLKVLLPNWKPKPRSFSIKLSHDVDFVRRFDDWRSVIRTCAGDLIKRQSMRETLRTLFDAVAQAAFPRQVSYFKGIDRLAEMSLRYGLGDDAFYFMAAEPGPLEGDYRVESRAIERCITQLQKKGFEIGLHASYQSFNHLERLAQEKTRLEAVLQRPLQGGRQHFLRFQVPDTWRHWERAGLSYDSTMAYADHEGFRCGTCHPFRPFDIEQDRELELYELPLVVMDQTLRQYRQFSPEKAKARILELAQRCKQVEGTFTLLWHNSSLYGPWRAWAKMYKQIVRELARMQHSGQSESESRVT